MTTRRFLSLWLPRLRTDRARRRQGIDPAVPLAATAKVAGAQRLVGVDGEAARQGLTVGLTLADARARVPALVAVEADSVSEAKLLEALCDWASRYTPLAGLDGRDGLMLDISGVTHLFGGEAALAQDCRARLARQGFGATCGVAGNPRAAYALARFSSRAIAPEPLSARDFAKLFHDLPLAALGLDETTITDMARAGLRRIGDVALRPRAPIAARFGPAPIARLDELQGFSRAAITPRLPAPEFCAERRFASPVQTVEAIEAALRRLAGELVALLTRRAKGARAVELTLYRVDGHVRRIRVGASRPLNEARAILRLFAEKLASPAETEIDAGFGVDCLRLACLTAEPLAPDQPELDRAGEAARARAMADLVDRLSARLGPGAVTRRTLVDAHWPEDAEAARPAVRGGCEADWPEGAGERPLRVFARPEPIEPFWLAPVDGPPRSFRWRRVQYDISAFDGPERIAPPWRAQPDAPTRDYYRAEDSAGRRFWLYREGLWGRETTQPKWRLHGLFG